MMGYVESPRAWSYARGMARTVGVSLPDAVVEGWLSRGELALIVETCGRCAHVAECTDWLAHTVTTETVPSFCQNGFAIASLRS